MAYFFVSPFLLFVFFFSFIVSFFPLYLCSCVPVFLCSSFCPFFLLDQKQCSPGFYQNEEQQASCLPCIPGTYADEEGASSSCKICLANQYRGNTMEATICVSCPSGWTSTNGSAKCTVCGAGEYGDVVGGGCKTCAAGSFRTSIDIPTECKLCLAGTYQDQAQQASCLPCVSDKAGMWIPFLCLLLVFIRMCLFFFSSCSFFLLSFVVFFFFFFFFFSLLSLVSSYPPFPFDQIPGAYVGEAGEDTACNLCLENQYRSFDMNATLCISCPQGWMSSSGSAKCQACESGRYGNVTGGGCKDCTAGLYRGASDGPTSCLLCSIGTYQDNDAQASCLPCIPGAYMDEQGEAVQCKLCSEHQYRSYEDNATACVNCPEGFSSSGGSAKCGRCGSGTYGDVLGGGCKGKFFFSSSCHIVPMFFFLARS